MKREVGIFGAGLITGAVILFLVLRQPASEFIVSGPKGQGSLVIKTASNTVNYEQVLATLFDPKEFLRPSAVDWLAKKQGLYDLKEPALVDALEAHLCDPIPQVPQEAALLKAKECAEKLVAKRLRALASDQKPPFHPVAITANAGNPERRANKPANGSANVCRPGPFFGKKLRVFTVDQKKSADVEATGSYLCGVAGLTFPEIQLGEADFRTLFGKRPLASLEKVLILPLD